VFFLKNELGFTFLLTMYKGISIAFFDAIYITIWTANVTLVCFKCYDFMSKTNFISPKLK
jgi:hypothetical protein